MISVDGYTIRKCLESTPRSALYSALRDLDGSEVLLKSYSGERSSDPDGHGRREYDALCKVLGPGVVRALDLILSGEQPVLVLESLPGMRLRTLLESRTLEPLEFLEVAIQLAQVLERVHEQRLIHRDLRPESVWIDLTTFRITLRDLVMAVPYGTPDEGPEGTLSSEDLIGLLLYMAPEQTGRMDRGVDFRSDLYALGATLYHSLVGAPPFEEQDPMALIHAHMARVPIFALARRPTLPPTLSRIVAKLLQKQPEDRYQTAHALGCDLLECRDQLRRMGKINDDLPLGTSDAPCRPLFTKRLYGRDAELSALHAAYARVVAGEAELAVLRGPPGIGKSALVDELRRPVAQSGGYMACGKFDLYRSELPYAGFITAFEALVQQLLSGSEEQFGRWRARLLGALGDLAPVLVQLVPELGILLGEVPVAPQLGPKETRARLAVAVERFVRCCARAEHPLVLFLDDLQWADAGSLYLLENLLGEGTCGALLVIGAYRDNEVEAKHPLLELFRRLERAGPRITALDIPPLGIDASAQMLAAALGRPVEETRRLAESVSVKTGSAPLLIQQFVLHVHALNLIRFGGSLGWTWDDREIAAVDIPESAVGLMVAKLDRLDAGTRELICTASCVGDTFDVALLAEVTGRRSTELDPILFALAEEGLLGPCVSGFRFVHDRIREAAQALLSPGQRIDLHRRAGLLLLEHTPPELHAERCFEIADHLNRARERLSEIERPRALAMDVMAGRRALAAGAAATATSYFEQARALLRAEDWAQDPKLIFGLFLDAAEAAFQSGASELALQLLGELEARPLPPLLEAQVLAKRIAVASYLREGDALGLTLAALRRFGVRWPRRPSWWRWRWEILRTDWVLRGSLDERLFPRPTAREPLWVAPVLVFSAGGAALLSSSIALPCFSAAYSLRAQRRHGMLRSPSFAFAAYAAFRTALLGDPRGAERFANAAREWMERAPSPTLDVRAEYELQAFFYPWVRPRRSVLEPLRVASERARDVGDVEYSIYSSRHQGVHGALCGEPLAWVLEHFELLHKRQQLHGGDYEFEEYRRAYGLLHEADARTHWERAFADAGQRLGASPDLAPYVWMHWVIVLVFSKEHRAAAELAERACVPALGATMVGPGEVDFVLFRGLAAAVLGGASSGLRRRRWSRIAHRCGRQLVRWARCGPDFVHMSLMLQAERARARRDDNRALRLYAEAARAGQEKRYRHHAALMHERRSDLLYSLGRRFEALKALQEALDLYLAWEAHAKVRELTERQNEWRGGGTDSP